MNRKIFPVSTISSITEIIFKICSLFLRNNKEIKETKLGKKDGFMVKIWARIMVSWGKKPTEYASLHLMLDVRTKMKDTGFHAKNRNPNRVIKVIPVDPSQDQCLSIGLK